LSSARRPPLPPRPPVPPGPRSETTGQAPVFAEKAAELVRRFESDDSDEGRSIRAEAIDLTSFFDRWKLEHPTNEDRVAAIQRLMDLSRRAMEHLSQAPRKPQS